MPRTFPKLECIRKAQAEAYVFLPEKEGDKRRDFGWAICTVNDSTGELLITSDWGNFAHRWSPDPKSLGSPTLTHFISEGHEDYLANKLLREGRRAERFSARATSDHLQKEIARIRLDHGRRSAAYMGSTRRERLTMSERLARHLWDELEELAVDLEHVGSDGGDAASALYFERIPEEIHEFISDLWEHSQSVPTTEAEYLMKTILPALIAACRETVELRETIAKAQRAEENRTP